MVGAQLMAGLAAATRRSPPAVSWLKQMAVFDAQLAAGKLYAPFMVMQDTVEGVLAGRTNQVYFPYASANPDKLDHIRLLGNNVFGFEDLGGGGDRDFNDMLVKVQLTA